MEKEGREGDKKRQGQGNREEEIREGKHFLFTIHTLSDQVSTRLKPGAPSRSLTRVTEAQALSPSILHLLSKHSGRGLEQKQGSWD